MARRGSVRKSLRTLETQLQTRSFKGSNAESGHQVFPAWTKSYAMCSPCLCVIHLLSLGPCFYGLSSWLPCRSLCPSGTSTEGRTIKFVCMFSGPRFFWFQRWLPCRTFCPSGTYKEKKQNTKYKFLFRQLAHISIGSHRLPYIRCRKWARALCKRP